MIQPQPIVGDTSLKRHREEVYIEDQLNKIPNRNKSPVYDFKCLAYYKGQILDFQLSQVFMSVRYAVLFFCNYDFTPQSQTDLRHIEEHYAKFIEFGALPIVITHDRAQIHQAFATPGKTVFSLFFEPSFIMASDSTDRLISRAFKTMNLETSHMQRSVVIIDRELQVLFTHSVADERYFPMKSILNCFEQTQIH